MTNEQIFNGLDKVRTYKEQERLRAKTGLSSEAFGRLVAEWSHENLGDRQDRQKNKMTGGKAMKIPNTITLGGKRYVCRIYDNGGATADRYTVCYKAVRDSFGRPSYPVLGMNAAPYHPQGIGQHDDYPEPIDRPSGRHLGRRIGFDALPADCQRAVKADLGVTI